MAAITMYRKYILCQLLGLYFNLIFIAHCLEIQENPKIVCTVTSAKVIASNVIRVLWKHHGNNAKDGQFFCQIRIAKSSCKTPFSEYTSDILLFSDKDEERSHFFWMNSSQSEMINAYNVCIRSLRYEDRDDDDDQDSSESVANKTWTIQILPVKVKQPPILKKCSVSVGYFEIHKTRFEKSEVYLFSKGDNINLTCDATGEPIPRIHWCRNIINCNPNELEDLSGTLHLFNAGKEHEGNYVATIYNEFGRLLSPGFVLKLVELGRFERDNSPIHSKFKAGVSFNLNCGAPVSVPTADIGWLKRPAVITYSNRIVLGLDGSLFILNAEVQDSGNYSCKVTNRDMDQSFHSKYIDVEVEDQVVFNTEPVLKNKDSSPSGETVIGLVGGSVKLQCVFSGRPIPQLLWYKDSKFLSEEFDESRLSLSIGNYTLQVKDLRSSDEGSYKCQANNSVTTSSHFTIKLIIHEPPRIIEKLTSRNVTVGQDVSFNCKSESNPPSIVEWFINGNKLTEDSQFSWYGKLSINQNQLSFFNISQNETCNIQCNISNDYGYILSSAYLRVFQATKIIQEPDNVTIVENKEFVLVHCVAETDVQTLLQITWLHGETDVLNDDFVTVFKNGSIWMNVTAMKDRWKKSLFQNYTCLAKNGLSMDNRTIIVQSHFVYNHQELRMGALREFGWSIGLVVGVSILVIVIVLFLRLHRFKSRSPSLRTASGSVGRTESSTFDSNDCLICDNSRLSLNERLKAAIKEMHIQRDRLQMEEIIGKGQFGRVYSALLHDPRVNLTERVAVKTMKYKPDESEMVELFLKEAVIMKDFQHLNVLGIRGITFDTDNSPMVILPYMANGDLRKYILNPELDVTILQLLMMGLQVAHGMLYLSEMRFVHRDLAARNCMVNDHRIVKVADFGLTRELILHDYYRVESSGTTPVPVRWMAPECLEANLFTTMSDVWSFGVLLWELMTRGAVPYPDVENFQIPNHVQSGKRLEQPIYCPDIVYEIMGHCWEVKQHERPSFQDLADNIENVIESAKPGTCMNSFLYQNYACNEYKEGGDLYKDSRDRRSDDGYGSGLCGADGGCRKLDVHYS